MIMADELVLPEDVSLMIVEDDRPFRTRLALTLRRKGFEVFEAESCEEGERIAAVHKPAFAVVDMRLGDGNGLDLVSKLHVLAPGIRAVILTGYGNIASAVAAIKSGAVDYLAKPAGADEILATLLSPAGTTPPPPEKPMSADRVKWEHIQRVYELCDRNVSETARRLNMHRRTLQRILAKRSPQ